MKWHGSSKAVAEYSAWKARSLGLSDRRALAKAGGIETVLSAMRAHPLDAAVQEDGCDALARFAVCDEACHKAVVSAGSVALLVAAMQEHAAAPEVQESAVSALASISTGSTPSEDHVMLADAL